MVIARGSYARFTDYPPFLLLLTSTWADLLILLIIHLPASVSPIKQHFMSLFSGNIFWCPYSNFSILRTSQKDLFCLNPNFDLIPDYDRLLDYNIYERSQIRFSVIVLCDSLNRETAPALWILPAFIPRRRAIRFHSRIFLLLSHSSRRWRWWRYMVGHNSCWTISALSHGEWAIAAYCLAIIQQQKGFDPNARQSTNGTNEGVRIQVFKIVPLG